MMIERRAGEGEKGRVNESLLHPVAQIFLLHQVLDHARQNIGQRAARFAGADHVHVKRRKDAREIAQRLRETPSIDQRLVQRAASSAGRAGCFSRFSSTPRLSSSVMPACKRWPSCSVKISNWPCGILRFCVAAAPARRGLAVERLTAPPPSPRSESGCNSAARSAGWRRSDQRHRARLRRDRPGHCARGRKIAASGGKVALKLTRGFACVHSLGYVSQRSCERRSGKKSNCAAAESVAVSEYGTQTGAPVFFCHGWPSSRTMAELTDAAARELNLRIISPDRPGIQRFIAASGKKTARLAAAAGGVGRQNGDRRVPHPRNFRRARPTLSRRRGRCRNACARSRW